MNRQQYAAAWAALAILFHASRVKLLRDVAVPAGGLTAGAPVQILDHCEPHPALPPALAMAEGEHGLLAVTRSLPGSFDAVVVLRESGPFSEGEQAWMALALPHIASALALGDQLASRLPTVASAEQLARIFPTPCLLTDEGARCIERNHAFVRMLGAMPGGVHNGRVVFDEPGLQDAWRVALLEGGITATTQSLAAATSSGDRWTVHIVPFHCIGGLVDGAPDHLMFVLFEKATAPESHARPMATTRPLTKAELEVLAGLLLGHTAKAIARQRGASVNTVRNQIATILGKTGHRTQKELMASFSGSAFEDLAQPQYESRS